MDVNVIKEKEKIKMKKVKKEKSKAEIFLGKYGTFIAFGIFVAIFIFAMLSGK